MSHCAILNLDSTQRGSHIYDARRSPNVVKQMKFVTVRPLDEGRAPLHNDVRDKRRAIDAVVFIEQNSGQDIEVLPSKITDSTKLDAPVHTAALRWGV